jgi:N-glycosylase/DNA lyase
MPIPAAVTPLTIPFPAGFDFWRTVYSHGWCSLLPFRVDKTLLTFSRLLRLNDGALVDCTMKPSKYSIRIEARSRSPLTRGQKTETLASLSASLRLGEDFSSFHAEARRHPEYRWIARTRSGRLLRAPTVFEDLVKMMCTTNCSWSLTTSMVHNLIGELGESSSDGVQAFPTPEAIAGVTEKFMRKKIRSGYRSPYLIECAERVASGELDVESWRTSVLSTEDLYHLVMDVKGMGPYAAGNLLRLLGRYNHLALDSWVRSQYAQLRHNGRKVSDRTIERTYRQYGRWRGLFFWLEMTRPWFDKKFPDW